MTQPFTMSIEPTGEKAYQYGFHLGTDEALARELIEERFLARNRNDMPTQTIALMRNNQIVDVFDGEWSSNRQIFDEEEYSTEVFNASRL